MSLNSREELRELFRTDPEAMVRHVLDLQTQREQLTQELLQTQGQIRQTQADLLEAKIFIAELTRQLFGQKAEKLSPEQEEQLHEVAGDCQEQAERPPPISRQCLEEELEAKKPQKERASRKRHPFPINLERVTVTLEPDLPPCPPSGVYRKIGEEVTEELDFVPATLSLRRIVQWMEQIALWLQPIYNRMWELMKEGDYPQIDETPVKVLDPEVKGKAATGYLWFYSAPGGDVIVEFSPSRGQEAPKQRRAGFAGTIQADAYEVYPCIERDLPGIQRLGCLAHSRRKFY